MIESEAIEICRQKAEVLRVPWDSESAVAVRRRVWPFSGVWRVVSQIQRDNCTVTMIVGERSQKATPVRVSYSMPTPARVNPHLVFLFVVKLISSGCLVWLVARYFLLWPVWGATIAVIPSSYVIVMVGTMFYYKLRSRKYGKDED